MIDEQVTAIAVGLIVVIAVFNVSSFYLSNRTVEPFSELGILGPNQKIADYPRSLASGQNFTLYLYVGNHEGRVTNYLVYVKLGNRSSTINENLSLGAPPLASYNIVLLNNRTYLAPITLAINRAGTNVRVVFELWTYQASQSAFVYDHRFAQIWMNISSRSP